MTFRRHSNACLAAVATAALVTAWCGPASAQQKKALPVKADAIGGQVTGANGPEAGVWVIAETNDLPTKYAKIVVTNDNGQFVIPQLPSANYKIWVRGYGLVDSDKQDAKPGKNIDLKAKAAPTAAAAAEYYPGMYWYAMLKIPPASEFPGSDKNPNGTGIGMTSQAVWIDSVKNSCQSCHALGSQNIRSPHLKELGEFKNSEDMWERRVQSGQAMNNMALTLSRMGPPRAYKMFADWTDRIAAGELPADKPERPTGVERNIVITSWAWGKKGEYLHDEVSTDKRNPTVNAYGKIYGSPEESSDDVPVLDPIKHVASYIKEPFRDPDTPSAEDDPMGPSVFWGDEAIWDGHTSIHNPMMDEKGRLWLTARIRKAPNPANCKAGSDLPSAQVAPLNESPRQASFYDPKTEKWTMVDTCFGTHHLLFSPNDSKLWFSWGQPYAGVVGWLDVKKFEETGDAMKSQGWTPIVANVSGTGKREPFVAADKPIEPGKDKAVKAAFYGLMPSVKGDVIWGQTMGQGFSRINQPAYLIRMIPGSDPTHTSVSEIFQSPPGTYGSRGIDIDSKGVAWTVLSSGQVASFDRSKCKEKLEGPNAATGAQCYEGWTLYRMPGPQFKDVNDPQGSANHAYYMWVDVHNTLGLGKDVPIATANGSESLLALVNGKFVNIRLPYPLGFFAKNTDGRIDDEKAGWKGRGVWTTTGTRAYFHSETGKDEKPRVYHVQLRPDPLAD
jgi:hypothetical protein